MSPTARSSCPRSCTARYNKNPMTEVDNPAATMEETQRSCSVDDCRYLTREIGGCYCLSHLAQLWKNHIEDPPPSEIISTRGSKRRKTEEEAGDS